MTADTASPAPPVSAPPATAGLSYGASVLRALRRNHVAQAAVAVLCLVVIVGLGAPLLAPHDPQAQDLTHRLMAPFWMHGGSADHLLGTDQLGRDVLSRVLYGTRISLLVGVSATVLSGVIGTLFGMLSGYFGRWVEVVLMRVADVQLSFPTILLALVIVAVLGPDLWFVVLVLGATGWVSYARVIRAEVMSLRSREFITAARAAGTGDLHIMWRHLRPNVTAPLLTIATLQIAAMIIAEASLSYLGLGVPPTIPTWGGMLSDGQLYIRTAWWVSVFGGGAIMLTTLSINVVGDMLRDTADPKAYRK
ncbi:ABC transporter permease [Streptomyces sp. ME03-5709C]|nr:ABC transporter permease [Streptomyces sp. ME03-5709C]